MKKKNAMPTREFRIFSRGPRDNCVFQGVRGIFFVIVQCKFYTFHRPRLTNVFVENINNCYQRKGVIHEIRCYIPSRLMVIGHLDSFRDMPLTKILEKFCNYFNSHRNPLQSQFTFLNLWYLCVQCVVCVCGVFFFKPLY